MRSPIAVLLAAQSLAEAVAATRFDWVDTLDDCWQDCLDSNGCASQKCICDSSTSDTYLTSALECTKTECEAEGWALDLRLLAPLQLWCAAAGNAIPESIIDSAYACATASTSAPATATRKTEHSTIATTQGGGSEIKVTTRSIFTQTTTDGEGHTVELIVPIIMGPSTMYTGNIITSTLVDNPMTTDTSSSASATATPTAETTSTDPTQSQSAPSSPASTPAAQATQAGPASGNGSPFENMQAGAMRIGCSGAVVVLALFAGAFVRW